MRLEELLPLDRPARAVVGRFDFSPLRDRFAAPRGFAGPRAAMQAGMPWRR